jgi:hypothetical protein
MFWSSVLIALWKWMHALSAHGCEKTFNPAGVGRVFGQRHWHTMQAERSERDMDPATILANLAQKIQHEYHPGALLLLGSFGTADAWERSDIDLAAVFDENPEGRVCEYFVSDGVEVAVSFTTFSGLGRLAETKSGSAAYDRLTALHAFGGARLLEAAGTEEGRARATRIISLVRDCGKRLAPAMGLLETARALQSLRSAEKAFHLGALADAVSASLQALTAAARASCLVKGTLPGKMPLREAGFSGAFETEDLGDLARSLLEEPLRAAEERVRTVLLEASPDDAGNRMFPASCVVELFPEMDHSPVWDNLFAEMIKRGVLEIRTLPHSDSGLDRSHFELARGPAVPPR